MSHFTVIVFGDDVEGQLTPYDEEIEAAPYFKKDEDWILKWGREKLPDIENPTLEQIAKAVSSKDEKYEVRDGKIGHITTYNLLSKWDWYCVGGRWTGYFPLKKGRTGEVGSPGLMTSPAEPGYADIARLKDIDVARARREAASEARKGFTMWQRIFEEHGKPESFESISGSGITIEKARELFWKQPAVKAVSEARLSFGCPVEQFGFDRKAYVDKARDSALVPFAYVVNGEWFERGKMGWFACVSDEKSMELWQKQFQKVLDNTDPETFLTLVVCHI